MTPQFPVTTVARTRKQRIRGSDADESSYDAARDFTQHHGVEITP